MACVYLLGDLNGVGYIGSTINLHKRLIQHKCKNNGAKSKYLTKPFECLVLEEIEDENNLKFAEQFYIKLYKDLYGDKLLNKAIPLRTEKEYRNDNKDKLDEAKKKHYIENRNKVLEQRNKYYCENREKVLEKNKKYYTKNKNKIAECECGSTTTILHKAQHIKSKKHQNFLDAQIKEK